MNGRRQFLAFLAVGGTAAAANVGVRVALSADMGYSASIVLAYGVGMTVAFMLNRALVFVGAGTSVRQQIGWFVTINLLGAAETLLVSLAMDRYVLTGLALSAGRRELFAHVLGVLAPVITSYFGHKHITFRAVPRRSSPPTSPGSLREPAR